MSFLRTTSVKRWKGCRLLSQRSGKIKPQYLHDVQGLRGTRVQDGVLSFQDHFFPLAGLFPGACPSTGPELLDRICGSMDICGAYRRSTLKGSSAYNLGTSPYTLHSTFSTHYRVEGIGTSQWTSQWIPKGYLFEHRNMATPELSHRDPRKNARALGLEFRM